MEVAARMTSKGRVTVPKQVRDAVDLREGDLVVFRVEGQRAVIARTTDLIDLAGAVPVALSRCGTPWDEVRAETRAVRSRRVG